MYFNSDTQLEIEIRFNVKCILTCILTIVHGQKSSLQKWLNTQIFETHCIFSKNSVGLIFVRDMKTG